MLSKKPLTYAVELSKAEVAEDKFWWTASLQIPSAHVNLSSSAEYGWKALLELAQTMKNMGLLE